MMKLPAAKVPNIDIAMLAAAVVEVPRWAAAFVAIGEPVAAAVPMGLLLAWAASEGWRAYFDNRRRILLLAINVASLAGALVTIAPVLYGMANQPGQDIDLSTVLPANLLWAWAAVLAITTFIPLVQIAAVKSYHRAETHTPVAPTATHVPAHAPAHDARAERSARDAHAHALAHGGATVDAQVGALLDALDGDATGAQDGAPDATERVEQRDMARDMRRDGATVQRIADTLGVHRSTVARWLK